MSSKENSRDASEPRDAGRLPQQTARRADEAYPAGRADEAEAPLASLARDAARTESFSEGLFKGRWSIVAGACLLVAAACLVLGLMDAAFVVATLGVVAWFWNERNRLRPRGIEQGERFRDEEEEFENRDEE